MTYVHEFRPETKTEISRMHNRNFESDLYERLTSEIAFRIPIVSLERRHTLSAPIPYTS